MRILFITRKYPPIVGGMEQFCEKLISSFEKKYETRKITLGKRQWWLPLFIPYALVKGLFLSRKADVVYFMDGAWTSFAWLFKLVSRKKVVVTVHGYDVTCDKFIYPWLVKTFLKRMNRVYCVSQNVREQAMAKGVSADKAIAINNGIDESTIRRYPNKDAITKEIKEKYNIPEGSKILMTVGRIRERKGQAWFIRNVLPKLEDVVYIIVGDGIGMPDVDSAIKDTNAKNVILAGVLDPLPGEDIAKLFEAADLHLMPNIRVKGEMEGFGIVNTEAAAYGTPTVGAGMEGIKDSVVDGVTGLLATPEEPLDYVNKINELLGNEARYAEISKTSEEEVAKRFTWDSVRDTYAEDFEKVIS